jgi:hypothetical protein
MQATGNGEQANRRGVASAQELGHHTLACAGTGARYADEADPSFVLSRAGRMSL